jgi:hypothetical protein
MSLHDRRQVPMRLFEAYLFAGKVIVVEHGTTSHVLKVT